MGFYLYECETDGKMELQKKMNDPDFTICPICNGKLTRLFVSNVNLNFNGSYNSSRSG